MSDFFLTFVLGIDKDTIMNYTDTIINRTRQQLREFIAEQMVLLCGTSEDGCYFYDDFKTPFYYEVWVEDVEGNYYPEKRELASVTIEPTDNNLSTAIYLTDFNGVETAIRNLSTDEHKRLADFLADTFNAQIKK